jgi:hypothetical protein
MYFVLISVRVGISLCYDGKQSQLLWVYINHRQTGRYTAHSAPNKCAENQNLRSFGLKHHALFGTSPSISTVDSVGSTQVRITIHGGCNCRFSHHIGFLGTLEAPLP